MEAEILVERVAEAATRSGNTRFVVRDSDGREYTTFRPAIGREAAAYEGRRARIEFHEEERNGFHNVYLDAIGPAAPPPAAEKPDGDADADEAAWGTAIEAAPWLVGSREPEDAVAPEEFFERLEPFKRLVADDIRKGGDKPSDE